MKQPHSETVSVAEAGRAGGSMTYAKYGRDHFQAIGRKGQSSLAEKVTLEQRRIWGSMGGRPRKHRGLVVGEKDQSE